MPSSPTPRRRAARTAGRQTVPWPSWLPRCAGRQSPGPGLPREEGRRVLEDVALLLQAPDALSQLPELLALGAGQPVVALTAIALALATPVPQRLRRHPQALRHIGDRAALTDQFQRLPPELLRVGRPCLRHRCPSLPRRFRRKCSGLRKIGGIPTGRSPTPRPTNRSSCASPTSTPPTRPARSPKRASAPWSRPRTRWRACSAASAGATTRPAAKSTPRSPR